MVVLVLAHMTRVFSMGAYKFPREINWLLGVGLLLLVMAFGFTGYLLPWDQRAYWATQVGTNIAGTAPLIGDFAAKLLKAGSQLGAATLTRFYAFHVLWLPALLGAVVLLHVGLVIRQGIAAPPAMLEDGAPRSTSGTDYQSYYQRAYSASKKGGARFWPDVVGKDVATSLAVVLALLLLALAFGAPLEPPADPTDTAYVPRPEWYFLPFFQLLKLFPGSMESTIAVGVPLLLVAVLIGLPFFDRGSRRNLRRRPAAMVAFSVVTVATTSLLVMAVRDVQPEVAPETGRALSSTERAGRALFRSRCSSCHVVGNQEGGSDGPELTDIGAKHGVEWLHSFVENPTRFHDESEMSPFGPPVLSHQEIEEVARYLSTLRGLPGHEVPPVFHDTFPDLTDARVPASRARP